MMKGLTILFIGLIGTLLTSCDPSIGVAIENRTKSDKQIMVIYPKEFKFPGDHEYSFGIRDSIKTFDLSIKDNYLKPTRVAKVDWDTLSRTYKFILKSNYSATIESRFLAVFPTWGQIFIIENYDTIKLEPKSKDFIKKPKITLGGVWTHKIIDKKE
jgi:hypothetical protein